MEFSSKQCTLKQIAWITRDTAVTNLKGKLPLSKNIRKNQVPTITFTQCMISDTWNRLSIRIPVFLALMQGLHKFRISDSRMKHMTSKESYKAWEITPTFEGNSVAFHQFLFPSLMQIKQLTIIIINLSTNVFSHQDENIKWEFPVNKAKGWR